MAPNPADDTTGGVVNGNGKRKKKRRKRIIIVSIVAGIVLLIRGRTVRGNAAAAPRLIHPSWPRWKRATWPRA